MTARRLLLLQQQQLDAAAALGAHAAAAHAAPLAAAAFAASAVRAPAGATAATLPTMIWPTVRCMSAAAVAAAAGGPKAKAPTTGAAAIPLRPGAPAAGAAFPNRGLLLKKLRRAMGPAAAGDNSMQRRASKEAQSSDQQHPSSGAKAGTEQERRAARRLETQQWLSAVENAAEAQGVSELAAVLERAREAGGGGRTGGGGGGGLLAHGAAVAARRLADARAGGSARHAQALVEALLERGVLRGPQAHRAAHAVLRAFGREGDVRAVSCECVRRERERQGPVAEAGLQHTRSSFSSTNSHRHAIHPPNPPHCTSFHQMLAAATRLYDAGDGECLLPGAKPPPATLELLLLACGRAGDGDALASVWRHLGPGGVGVGGGGGGSGGTAAPDRRAARALLQAAVECDARAAGLLGGGGGGSSSDKALAHARGAAARGAPYGGAVSRALFCADGSLAEALAELADAFPELHRRERRAAGPGWGKQQERQQQQQQQQQQQRHGRREQHWQQQRQHHATEGASPAPPPPLPLVPPDALLPLLRAASSVADVDALLAGQLAHARGLPLSELRALMRRRPPAAAAAGGGAGDPYPLSQLFEALGAAASDSGNGGSSSGSSGELGPRGRPEQHARHGDGDSSTAAGASPPQLPPPGAFPPALPPPAAAAAVRAYLRHGAFARAAAVARAVRCAPGRDQDPQAAQALIAGAARLGLLVPALNAADALRSLSWRGPSPAAAAALLLCAARARGLPLGARAGADAVLAVWRQHGMRHPTVWAALLRALWEVEARNGDALARWAGGDAGGVVGDALLAAMARPMEPADAPPNPNAAAISGSSGGLGAAALEAAQDAARSTVLGALISAILTAPAGGGASSSSSSGRGGDGSEAAPQPVFGGRRRRHAAHVPLLAGGGAGGSLLPAFDANARAPGWEVRLPLRFEQQLGAAARVRAALAAFALLRARGVAIRDDAALGAALQALRLCRHGADAHTARLLPRLMGAALALGVRPGARTRRALLGVCEELDARGGSGSNNGGDGLGAFAYAQAPAASVGGVTLERVLALARAEVAASKAASGAAAAPPAGPAAPWRWGGDAERVAAGVMRALAFEHAFGAASGGGSDDGGSGGGGGDDDAEPQTPAPLAATAN